MSHILSALLITRGTSEKSAELVDQFNEWIGANHNSKGRFVRLDDKFTRAGYLPQFEVYGVAINYAELAELRKQIEAKPWGEFGTVQLVISCEHDDGAQLINCVGTPSVNCCGDERL